MNNVNSNEWIVKDQLISLAMSERSEWCSHDDYCYKSLVKEFLLKIT